MGALDDECSPRRGWLVGDRYAWDGRRCWWAGARRYCTVKYCTVGMRVWTERFGLGRIVEKRKKWWERKRKCAKFARCRYGPMGARGSGLLSRIVAVVSDVVGCPLPPPVGACVCACKCRISASRILQNKQSTSRLTFHGAHRAGICRHRLWRFPEAPGDRCRYATYASHRIGYAPKM